MNNKCRPPSIALADNTERHCTYYTFTYGVPGVIQLESKAASVGSSSPRSFARFAFTSASFADRNLSFCNK
jgi:hypothetical protein